MKPYLAVIADSFRAAFASRILWLALGLVGLFLVVVAPVSYHQVSVSRFSQDELVGRERLIEEIAKALQSSRQDAPVPAPVPAAVRVARALPAALLEEIAATARGEAEPPRRRDLVDAFNGLLDDEATWYDEASWEGTTRLREQRRLEALADVEMSEAEQRRRARLRLEGALPGVFRPRPDTSIVISYLGWDTPVELPIRRSQFQDVLNEYLLPVILRFLLGMVGIMLGILVTASVIPDMLQPGSLHLLLSKPISRPLLYLARFVGGCAFVFLCVVPLIVGMWLIAGFRLDLWNARLLLCIPIFMLLFAVYFSVSALVGLWWRSGIVSVAVTVVFWVACGLVGWTAELFEGFVSDPARITRLAVQARPDDASAPEPIFLGGRKDADFVRLDPSREQWVPLSDAGLGGREQIEGPIFLNATLAVATRVRQWPGGGGRGEGNRTLLMLEAIDQWQPHVGPELPGGTLAVAVARGARLLAVSNRGLFQATAEGLRESDRDKPDTVGGSLFGGLTQYFTPGSDAFQEVTPATLRLQMPLALATSPDGEQAIVYARGQLFRLVTGAAEPPWQQAAVIELPGDGAKRARLAVAENRVIVFRDEEPAVVCDLETLEVVGELPLPKQQTVAAAAAAPVGTLAAVLLSDGRLARIDLDTLQLDFPSAIEQGQVESMSFDRSGVLWVGVDVDRVIGVDWQRGRVMAAYRPSLSTPRRIQRYLVEPLHTIVPQTGKLSSETVSAVVGGTTSRAMGEGQLAEATREQLEVTRPILSCTLFIVVLLSLGCLYIRRQDF